MKPIRLLLALAGGLALALALLAVLAPSHSEDVLAAPAATVRYVLAEGGIDTGNCTDSQNPCRTVQYALGQASDGDAIQVANKFLPSAVYTGTIVITKSVTLEGGWNVTSFGGPLVWNRNYPCEAFRTTLDGQGNGRVISITGHITPTIDCFTITGGDANLLGGDPSGNDAGGGICSQDAAPIITNNIITGNYGCDFCSGAYGRGGGIYLRDAPATAVISGNLVANNVADESTWGQGGGILLQDSDAQVLNNTIERNRAGHSAGDGGGIAIKGGSPTVADNDVLWNLAGTGVMCNGGGIYVRSSTPVTIERNLIQNNRSISGSGVITMASKGGGIYYAGNPTVSAVIRDNTIRYNIASIGSPQPGNGGGVYLSGLVTPALLSGNTVNDNYASFSNTGFGGGLYLNESTAAVVGNYIFLNTAATGDTGHGGGIYVNGGAGLIQSNTITRNVGVVGALTGDGRGGGLVISGSVVIVQDNRIIQNAAATAPNSDGVGGGFWVYLGTPRIAGNQILSNTTGDGRFDLGGGLFLGETSPSLEGNTIIGNRAVGTNWGRGGGVRIAFCPTFTLTNNIIARNRVSELGSGVAVAGNSVGDLIHNTIAENLDGDGVGVHVDLNSDATLYNNIIVSHTVGITNADIGGSTVAAKYTLFEGNGTDYGGGVSSSYEVAGPAALLANYHLGAGSNAIDTAVILSWVTNDIDGDLRPRGSSSDVGADELTCLARLDITDYFAIQDAIDAAAPGETVQVAEGTCYENLRITRTVTLEGGWDTAFTSRYADPAAHSTIDGMGTGRVISITGDISGPYITPTIDGFTITNGDATGLGGGSSGYDAGGGIYSWTAWPTVANCHVMGNTGSRTTYSYGGGLSFHGAVATLKNVEVYHNSGTFGGGAYFSNATNVVLTGSQVYSNTGGMGGGLYLSQCPFAMLENNRIHGNSAEYAGGIWLSSSNIATLRYNQVYNNTSIGLAGGVWITGCDDATLTGNRIYRNTANEDGGGVFLMFCDDASLVNNMVVENRIGATGEGAGILANDTTARLLHTTLARNRGGDGSGLHVTYTSTVVLANTILASHTVGITVTASSAVTLEATLWGDGTWANGTAIGGNGFHNDGEIIVVGDPGFWDPGAGNYHIRAGSEAIDAGIGTGVDDDIDGNPRPIGDGYDIGADEVWLTFLPLVMRNYP